MPMVRFKHSGSFSNTEKLFRNTKTKSPLMLLEKFGRAGVSALASATPKDTGTTANLWEYEIEQTKSGYKIYWTNSNTNDYVSIALILQYGHATGNGGYVEGVDYINPALRPIFEQIADHALEEIAP